MIIRKHITVRELCKYSFLLLTVGEESTALHLRKIFAGTRVCLVGSRCAELLERIRRGRLRVRELGLLPALRPSSTDRHIFPDPLLPREENT